MITKIGQYRDIIPDQVYTNGKDARVIIGTERQPDQLLATHTVDYKTPQGVFAPSPINARSFKAWVNNRKNLPQKVWANAVNLSGMWFADPTLCVFNIDSNQWWSMDGNFDIAKLGYGYDENVVTFASVNVYEVLCWMAGVHATMKMLGRWCQPSNNFPPL